MKLSEEDRLNLKLHVTLAKLAKSELANHALNLKIKYQLSDTAHIDEETGIISDPETPSVE